MHEFMNVRVTSLTTIPMMWNIILSKLQEGIKLRSTEAISFESTHLVKLTFQVSSFDTLSQCITRSSSSLPRPVDIFSLNKEIEHIHDVVLSPPKQFKTTQQTIE